MRARSSADPEHTRRLRIFSIVRLFCASSGIHMTLRIAENSFTTRLIGSTSCSSNPGQRPSRKLLETRPEAWPTISTKTHEALPHQGDTKTSTRPHTRHTSVASPRTTSSSSWILSASSEQQRYLKPSIQPLLGLLQNLTKVLFPQLVNGGEDSVEGLIEFFAVALAAFHLVLPLLRGPRS